MESERYKRNIPAITKSDQESLKEKSVAVVGCGGLGGFVIEALARLGVGSLRLIDADSFSESNLNRQLYATEKNIGKSKAKAAELSVSPEFCFHFLDFQKTFKYISGIGQRHVNVVEVFQQHLCVAGKFPKGQAVVRM